VEGAFSRSPENSANKSRSAVLPNMALFGKLFLKEKFIFYECHDCKAFRFQVDFLSSSSTVIFYVITSVRNGVETVVGFFTKEKDTTNENNLACIIVFPPYQNKGFGSLMIKFGELVLNAYVIGC
jgi:histone acetyltransferase MYST1